MFSFGRNQLSLDGTWKFCPDPMERCRRQKWWVNLPDENRPFPCWDPEGLWDIRVPGTWKTQFEELKWYDGHAVYLKDFDYHRLTAEREAFLVFDGIVYESVVYLNGQLVAHHEWGYSQFSVRVTELLQEKNRLFVLVDNHLRPDRVPGEVFDWNNDGGIINGVSLVETPAVYIDNFRVATRLNGEENVIINCDIWLKSRNLTAAETIFFRIPDLGIEEKVYAVADKMASVEVHLPRSDIELWSPENPRLYRTELVTASETLSDDIGYREIRSENQQIILNGEPIRLYGLSVHSEFKDSGRTATKEGIDKMIAAAKKLGVNFLRCAHYPYAEIFGRAMDRAGLLWWEEVPAYWLSNMGEAGQRRKACGMMAETVRRDWNRASLAIWSVSNECCWCNPDNPDDNNYAYWFEVVPLVRKLDPSRLISCAEAGNVKMVRPIWSPDQADIFKRSLDKNDSWSPGHTDEWYALFDILAANIYCDAPGQAPEAYRRYVQLFSRYNKPMILSEFGSMSLRGKSDPNKKFGSEEFHAATIREAYEVFRDLPELTGYCPWCLVDIRVPLHWRWYNQGKALFRYGFLDENWREKQAFSALKDAIAELKEHHKKQSQ